MSTQCTINGWYWYCDEHDTHGNADSKQEAAIISQAHLEWHKEIYFESYKNNLEPDEIFDPNYEVETCEIDIYKMKNGK